MSQSLEELVANNNAIGAYQMVEDAMLDDDQKTWLWDQLKSSTKAAIKKAKGN